MTEYVTIGIAQRPGTEPPCADGYDVQRHSFNDWRELVAYGNISWPEKPPAALGEGVVWTEPQPYIHIHMALSGGPGKNDEVLVGHLSDGKLKGGMATQIYELLV